MTSTATASSTTEAGPGRAHAPRVAAVVVGAAAVVYLALVAASGDGLPRGATVLGVEVGGQSQTEAVATLQRSLAATVTRPIAAKVGTDTVTVVPATAGLGFDAAATVAGAAGRAWNPVTLLSRLVGGPALEPVVSVEPTKLDQAISTLASGADEPAKEPQVLVQDGSVDMTSGVVGRVVDRQAARAALTAAYLRTNKVVVPIVAAAPTVSDDEAAKAADAAKTLISGPVDVHVAAITAVIPAGVIAEALSFTPENGHLVPSLDGQVLRATIAPRLAGVEKPGRDATWDVSSGTPVLVPSRVGVGVNPTLLAKDVLVAAQATDPAKRSVQAQIGTIPPTLTTAQAAALGVTEQLSSFTQHFPYAAYRVQNIGEAARRINGTLLKPGDTFSLNKTLGERTVDNGYTKGFVVGPGGVFKEDLGGGVSTSATATWTAAFYAGLQRVHTQAHSIWITRYRPGLEATVAWGSFDMSFRNDTPHAVLITTVMRNTSITVAMWGTKVYDEIKAESGPFYDKSPALPTQYDTTATCHPQTGLEGFSIDVVRVFIKGGKEVRREKITTRYRPSPTVVCHADPAAATPTPSASSSGGPTSTTAATPSTPPSARPAASAAASPAAGRSAGTPSSAAG